MAEYDRMDRSAYITLGIIVGTAAGLVAGMLTAPKSGKEMRDDMMKRAQDMTGRAKEQMASKRQTLSERLSNTLDKSKKIAEDVAETAKEKIAKSSDRSKRNSDQDMNEESDYTAPLYG